MKPVSCECAANLASSVKYSRQHQCPMTAQQSDAYISFLMAFFVSSRNQNNKHFRKYI